MIPIDSGSSIKSGGTIPPVEDIPSFSAKPLISMDHGITLPAAGPLATPEALTAIATLAESVGFTSVWVSDHIAIPEKTDSRYPYREDGRPPWPASIPYLDAFTALTWVGAVTRTVRLGTSVLVLPMRPPLIVAKAAATLDALTGGRVILGVGAGWMREEFDLLGQPFETRGRRMDEAVRVLKACWSDDPVRFEGKYFRLPPFGMDPKPRQGPRLPVIAGGEGDVALRRVANVCDGWHPLNLGPDEVAERLGKLRELAAQAGRRYSDLLLTARPGLQRPLTPDLASRYEAVGIRMLVSDLNYRELTLPEALGQVGRLAKTLHLS